MPFFRIETNVSMEHSAARELAAKASDLAAKALGKPEQYVQAMVSPGAALLHGGTDAPAAAVSLFSIGLSESQCAPLSETICAFLEQELSIPPDRVYINFKDLQRSWFGWNMGTF